MWLRIVSEPPVRKNQIHCFAYARARGPTNSMLYNKIKAVKVYKLSNVVSVPWHLL